MIFADKLITLRKKAGWSQEELAEKLNVTRQSVSKWEGAQSVPDIDKILQLSRLFGVTTDYLLKDDAAEPEYTEDDTSPLPRVTLAQANDYLAKARANAPKLALAAGALLCQPGHWQAGSAEDAAAVAAGAVFFFGAGTGIVEEAVFRGVLMTAVERRWNKTAAVLGPSLAFALLHVLGRELSFAGILQLLQFRHHGHEIFFDLRTVGGHVLQRVADAPHKSEAKRS